MPSCRRTRSSCGAKAWTCRTWIGRWRTVPTRDALGEALRAEGLSTVDVWLGFPNAEHVRQVAEVLRPRAFIPHHWDDFWEPMTAGLHTPYRAAGVTDVLTADGVRVLVPARYFERFRLDAGGVNAEGDSGPI